MLGTLSESPMTTPTRVALGSLCYPLWLMLMPQRMLGKEGAAFWNGLDLEMEGELELGVPPPDVQLENVGQQMCWGLEPEPVEEGLLLPAVGVEPIEV